jgi:hypothetical protein
MIEVLLSAATVPYLVSLLFGLHSLGKLAPEDLSHVFWNCDTAADDH